MIIFNKSVESPSYFLLVIIECFFSTFYQKVEQKCWACLFALDGRSVLFNICHFLRRPIFSASKLRTKRRSFGFPFVQRSSVHTKNHVRLGPSRINFSCAHFGKNAEFIKQQNAKSYVTQLLGMNWVIQKIVFYEQFHKQVFILVLRETPLFIFESVVLVRNSILRNS